MANFTIDSSRSVNEHSRNNYTRGEKNTFVYATESLNNRVYLHPNNIYNRYASSIYSDDRLWQNLDTIVKAEAVPKDITPYEVLFGFQSSEYALSFPPSLVKFSIT
jgi:hypothetical protein